MCNIIIKTFLVYNLHSFLHTSILVILESFMCPKSKDASLEDHHVWGELILLTRIPFNYITFLFCIVFLPKYFYVGS